MEQKRYQVFISSTFTDLKGERDAVLNAILLMNHIPAGMELFPAANQPPWNRIKGDIEQSDYYVLIIAGRYGSLIEADGISYTEREYDYAVANNKPVLAFVHSRPGSIAADFSEAKPEIKAKLAAFQAKVEAKHSRTEWSSTQELASKVVLGLTSAFMTDPAVGWVRATQDPEINRKYIDALERIQSLEFEISKVRLDSAGAPTETEARATIEYEKLQCDTFNVLVSCCTSSQTVSRYEPNLDKFSQGLWSLVNAGLLSGNDPSREFSEVRVTSLGWAVIDEGNMRRLLHSLHPRPALPVLRIEETSRFCGFDAHSLCKLGEAMKRRGWIYGHDLEAYHILTLTSDGHVAATRLTML